MTPLEKSALDILEARDVRQSLLDRFTAGQHSAVLFVSLNVPGRNKVPEGHDKLFSWAIDAISLSLTPQETDAAIWFKGVDVLGLHAVVGIPADPCELKHRCIHIETAHPVARLLDLDVYTAQAEQIDRGRLGLPRRVCLLCDEPAVDCIRQKKHSSTAVIQKAHELLKNFTP